MASEKQAQSAAAKIKSTLLKKGAFAMDIRKLDKGRGFAVFAFFEKAPSRGFPDSILLKEGVKEVRVPLRVIVTNVFRPD
jgi:hypothetical protein